MEITEGKIKRLRNLPSFKNKTDEELREYLANKVEKPRKPRKTKTVEAPKDEALTDEEIYTRNYDEKLAQLKDEYGIDMNNSNDAENLRMLVKLSIQFEEIDKKIRGDTFGETLGVFDDRRIKNLGDYQKGLVASITDLQDKLGITRKVRKEKQIDDIPQYLKEIRRKANDFWNRKTSPVRCEKCQIELARYWLNFPDLATSISMQLECWKCGEKVVYVY